MPQDINPTDVSAKKTIPVSVTAYSKAKQIVKNKYSFPQRVFGEDRPLFYVESRSPAFDRILRRRPVEVYRYSDSYVIPLGYSCIETVVSAYGLSFAGIYRDSRWEHLVGQFNQNMTPENARNLISFLHGAAIIKNIAINHPRLNTSNPIPFTVAIQSLSDYDLVDAFAAMVR